MKTILYQPIFINPQAYFVFPQLYHIEKGDSYIEPANITGQLIINNLSEGLTLTPMMLFIKENSDRCHYYNGKWNKKDLAIGISSIVLGSITKYFITLI